MIELLTCDKLNSKIKTLEVVLKNLNEKLYLKGIFFLEVVTRSESEIRHPLRHTLIQLLCFTQMFLSLHYNERRVSMMVGDFAFDWKLKSMWNWNLVVICTITLGKSFWSYYSKHNVFQFNTIG